MRSAANRAITLAIVLIFASCTLAAQPSVPPPTAVHGFDMKNLDKTVDPTKDFYRYAIGDGLPPTRYPPSTPGGAASTN